MLLTYQDVLNGIEIKINDIIERNGRYFKAVGGNIQTCGIACPLNDENGNCKNINCNIGLIFDFQEINEIEMLVLTNK